MSGEIDNNTFIDAANATSALDTGGMIGVLDLTTPYTGFGGDFPRIFNRTVFFDTVQDGQLVPRRRPGLRHDRPDRRPPDGLTDSPSTTRRLAADTAASQRRTRQRP